MNAHANLPVANAATLVAEWLRHPCDARRIAVVPSDAGARFFRHHGRRGYLEQVAEWAESLGADADTVHVVDRLPQSSGTLDWEQRREPRLLGVDYHVRERCLISLLVPFELAIFRGHFPSVPIVPGAMLAGWAALLGARHLGWAAGVRRSSMLKFRRIVQPGPVYQLALELRSGEGRLDFRYQSTAGLHAAGSLLDAAP